MTPLAEKVKPADARKPSAGWRMAFGKLMLRLKRGGLERARDMFDAEALDDVAGAHILVIF